MWLGLAPCPLYRYSGQLSYGAVSVGAVLSACCPEIRDVHSSGTCICQFGQDIKGHPLFDKSVVMSFDKSLLFGLSVKREFTVHGAV